MLVSSICLYTFDSKLDFIEGCNNMGSSVNIGNDSILLACSQRVNKLKGFLYISRQLINKFGFSIEWETLKDHAGS